MFPTLASSGRPTAGPAWSIPCNIKGMRALVTGATGFVGSHLAELLISQGVDVVAPVRNANRLRWAAGLKARIVETNYGDGEALRSLVADRDTIFHVAGLTKSHVPGPFYRANLMPTAALVEAAVADGRPRRFILVSSLAAAGSSTPGRPRREEDPSSPVTPYGWSKLRAEEVLLKYRDRMDIAIVRPPTIYGPRDSEAFPLFKLASLGLAITPVGVDPLVSMILVGDLVDGIWQLAQAASYRQPVYFMAHHEQLRFNEFSRRMATHLGRRPVEVKVPLGLLEMVGWSGWAVGALTGNSLMMDRYKVRDFRQPAWTCDPSRVEAEHGIRAATPFHEGMVETIEWYQRQGWL